MVVDDHRFADRRDGRGCQLPSPSVVAAVHDGDELVTARAEHVRSEVVLQTSGDLDEEPVAGLVPEGVVHPLEVVHVDEHHGDRCAVAA